MKSKTQIIVFLAFAVLIAAAVIVQAAVQTVPSMMKETNAQNMQAMMGQGMHSMHHGAGMMGMIDMDRESMDKMHDQMTKNMQPEMKEAMDKMHESCMDMMSPGD